MKRFLLLLLFVSIGILPALSNEIEDDYLDIAANYCVVGDYNSAMTYLDKILQINPSNKHAADLKRGLNHVISKDKKSFIDNVSPLVREAMEYKRVGDETKEWNTLVKATEQENSYLAKNKNIKMLLMLIQHRHQQEPILLRRILGLQLFCMKWGSITEF